MNLFRILVADDDAELNEGRYKRLLDEPSDFEWEFVDDRSEFERTRFEEYDAVLLDVNLDKWRHMSLSEAVGRIAGRAPIVLASGQWGKDKTAARIQEVLAQSKEAHFVQILILDDLVEPNWERRVDAIRSQLRLAIARHRRHGVLRLDEHEPLHILHLSDPQYGDPDTDGWASMAEEEIARFLAKIQPHIHFLAVTGDITYQGHPGEYANAQERLETLLQELFINREDWRERVLLVPGNHDVNLRLASADCVKYDFGQRQPVVTSAGAGSGDQRRYALHPFREFAWKLTGDPNWRDADDLCWLNDSFRHLGVRFYLLNSVGNIDCTDPDRARVSLDALRMLVREQRHDENLFPIAFCHHGPPKPSDRLKDRARNTASCQDNESSVVSIANWADVSKLLQTTGIRLFIHGHGHKREVARQGWDHRDTSDKGGKIGMDEFLRVMAPTTHLNEKLRDDGAGRGFSIITLHRRGGRVARVEIDSYELASGTPQPLERDEFWF